MSQHESRGLRTAVSSLLPPQSSQGLNPGPRAWWQASLLTEPRQWAFYYLLKLTVSSRDAPHRDDSIQGTAKDVTKYQCSRRGPSSDTHHSNWKFSVGRNGEVRGELLAG